MTGHNWSKCTIKVESIEWIISNPSLIAMKTIKTMKIVRRIIIEYSIKKLFDNMVALLN